MSTAAKAAFMSKQLYPAHVLKEDARENDLRDKVTNNSPKITLRK